MSFRTEFRTKASGSFRNIRRALPVVLLSATVLAVGASSSCLNSSATTWTNTSLPAQTAQFTATYDATPNQNSMDGVIGLSFNAATGYASLATITRFATTGTIDVRNAGAYSADVAVPYSAGLTYHFRLLIDPTTKTYTVYVTPPGGTELKLATSYAFRSEQSTASTLNNWSSYADIGSQSVCNMAIGSGSTVTPPTISTQPASQTITAGQMATFAVVAAGTAPLSYQWKKNTVNITGATSASYTTPATTTSDSGSTFTAAVSNTAGTATSAAATLTVNPAQVVPTITTPPASQTVTAGQTATFTVVAAGTAPMVYQWRKNAVNIVGATSASYMTPATTTSDSGSTFSVAVSNSVGSITSNPATLAVNAPSSCLNSSTTTWTNTSLPAQTAQFTATYDATPNQNSMDGVIGLSFNAATGYASLATITRFATTGTIDVRNAGAYSADVAVPYSAGLTYHFRLLIDPTTKTYTVYVTPPGGTELKLATSYAFRSEQSTASTLNNWSSYADIGSQSVCNMAIGSGSTVTPPTISTQPASQTITAGQMATFAVVAAGTAPLSYQWKKNTVNITGATSASYTTPATTTSDSGSTFTAAVSNTAGTATSAAATLTVNPAQVVPTITTPPASQTMTAGQTATFTVVAAGTAPMVYQWRKNAANIAGATSASYTTPATTTSDSGSTFAVVVTNTAGTVTSGAATLTVNPAAVPAIQVSSASINFGNDVVGTNSTQPLIITNTGTATLTISQVNKTGSAFSVSGYTLPLNVNAGKQTTITIAFLPTSVGAAIGNISIVSNAPTSPTSVGLSGTGTAATLTLGISPPSLSFGNVTMSTSSAPQNVTITNTGNANVTFSQITLNGSAYGMTGGSAPVTLSPSQNLILTLRFSPTVAGSISGSISMVSNASGSPATVSLSGTGVAAVQHSVALTWNASTSTVSGYNVYRGTVSGGPYTKINSSLLAILSYTDSTVQSGTTYYYVTTAVDSGGDESVYSTGASGTIP